MEVGSPRAPAGKAGAVETSLGFRNKIKTAENRSGFFFFLPAEIEPVRSTRVGRFY